MTKTKVSLFERAEQVTPPIAQRATKLGVTKAEGSYVYTEDGEKYLDFASGVAVMNVGHNHPKVIEAAKNQMDDMIHAGHNVVYYPSYVELAEKLNELNGGDKMVYFSNSGAEVNEGAIKLAKKVTKRPAVISFKRGFHGRTLAATSITASNASYREDYEGLMPSVYYADYPYAYKSGLTEEEEVERCLNQLEEVFKFQVAPSSVATIVLEPVQGEGGYIVPPKQFLQKLREICDEHGILLTFDEIQTGFGRTGKMFAYEHFGVEPDILTLAKGIASGFPLSALIAPKKIMEQWPAGTHGGTYGGNPISCAASLASIEILENEGLKNAQELGQYFKDQLLQLKEKYSTVGDVRGIGLMLAVELVKEDGSPNAELLGKLRNEAQEQGVILLGCGTDKNVIRFIPPTTVTKDEIDRVLTVVEEGLKH
ncbi:aspartate aminotransferase family protein [Alkalibacillus haloalkaliphilus]|uniref:aspartate aminotransferase family protein n=1 Tax=Alkalibacillus haloalkaliphilus TaxID=94136 RepID=UPI00293603EE|nr:aspartate aminotransferase family protein [Alkalibacillus haloalkaliphilus]MDV2582179.1 aspartate aminotransferase family protein [Alkalibacillus haloalkaliphilus]